MDNECVVCGHPYPEEHHTVFRGQQSALIKCPYNKKSLCYEHHRGNKGPHMNKETDLKYKRELQLKLESLFSFKECYTEEEVKIILLISKKDAHKLVKTLAIKVDGETVGFHREDIIRQAMGGRNYKEDIKHG